jgi:hypothetical protein
VNANWHHGHRMPKSPSLQQRVQWHVAHAKACACRGIPRSIVAELQRRGLSIPKRRRR